MFSLFCHLLVAFLIIDKVGVSVVAKFVACDVFFEKILSGHDSNFSLSTLDVLKHELSVNIYVRIQSSTKFSSKLACGAIG